MSAIVISTMWLTVSDVFLMTVQSMLFFQVDFIMLCNFIFMRIVKLLNELMDGWMDGRTANE